MFQIGSFCVGFAMFIITYWLPIWRVASIASAEQGIYHLFSMLLLLFGVFFVSADRSQMSMGSALFSAAMGVLSAWFAYRGIAVGTVLGLGAVVMSMLLRR